MSPDSVWVKTRCSVRWNFIDPCRDGGRTKKKLREDLLNVQETERRRQVIRSSTAGNEDKRQNNTNTTQHLWLVKPGASIQPHFKKQNVSYSLDDELNASKKTRSDVLFWWFEEQEHVSSLWIKGTEVERNRRLCRRDADRQRGCSVTQCNVLKILSLIITPSPSNV